MWEKRKIRITERKKKMYCIFLVDASAHIKTLNFGRHDVTSPVLLSRLGEEMTRNRLNVLTSLLENRKSERRWGTYSIPSHTQDKKSRSRGGKRSAVN